MWVFDKDQGKWLSKDDNISKESFDIYKQELSSYRFYSKCLSGATYIPVNNLDNIYDIISNYIPRNWYITSELSVYAETTIPTDVSSVSITDSENYYTKYLSEYGLTLKNKFTPERLIKDSLNNFITVDIATVDTIDLFNISERIDGIKLLEGHKVLVKNQTTSIVLPVSTDPNNFFQGNYQIVENFGSTIEYRYLNEENGIYLYTNNQLVKQNELDDYQNAIRYSISIKLGDINRDKQFHLSRLKTGYYPQSGEPVEFIEKKNWLLRNRVDYNNLFDLNFYGVIKHGEQSYTFEGFTYSIPERAITVGEFGTIINTQADVSNIINNKYKFNLRDISETSAYYWIVGDRGMLLRVRKHDFNVERIEVDCQCPSKIIITNLKSIDFFNDLNGVAVGELNTILITNDGGLNWERIKIDAFDSYYFNKVIYAKSDRFFIAGDNGIFIEFRRDLSGWTAYRRRVSRFEDSEDDYLLVDDINDLVYVDTNTWNLDYTFSTQSTATHKELIILATNDSKLIIHDINNSIPFETEFFYLNFNKNYGDIVNISRRLGTNEIVFTCTGNSSTINNSGMYAFNLSSFDYIGVHDPISNVIISSSQSFEPQVYSSIYTNRLFDYNGEELIIAGNNSISKFRNYNQGLFSDLDPNFDSRLKSKMLFLDYDIASKLNFFTDEGDYRLPNEITYSNSFSTLSLENIQDETNWFNYWQDRQMTFEYYNDEGLTENMKVLISASFSYTTYSTTEILPVTSATNSLATIQNLAPTIADRTASRYYKTGTSITEPIDNHKLYLYDYLMIYEVDFDYPVDKGDVMRLKCDIIDSNFIVNKIVELNNSKYIYMFTEFNQNIINNLLNYTVEITNLNKFENITDLIDNFNTHPISIGYSLETYESVENGVTYSLVKVSAKFNNLTSYYNMATNVKIDNNTLEMRYMNSFLKFGYTPTYNILDYLTNIDSSLFTDNKEYLVMPIYKSIPHGTSIDNDSVFIDRNKLHFGKNLKNEWQSLFINTFVDLNTFADLNTTTIDTSNEKLLITKKYELTDSYVIEFHKVIQKNNPVRIDIISRRKLKQISEDLQELNNIQRPLNDKTFKNDNYLNDVALFKTYEKLLNFRINTDSYAKILLSDLVTLESITAILYIDDKNELSMNITRVDNERIINILNTASTIDGKLLIQCQGPHELNNGDGVVLEFTGGPGSSQELNPQYFGYKVITVINDNNFSVDVDYSSEIITVGNDTGLVKYIKKDPFLNYQPVDITDIGTDKRGTRAIELIPDNTRLEENIVSLVNVDFNKFRFRLVDGLNVETLSINYSWVYEAEISDAVIGLTDNQLTWYKGTWECGRWFGGRWLSGTWISGDWYDGTWESKLIKDNWINVEVDDRSSNVSSSIWLSGRWFNGTWNNGTWVNGRWYGGEWNNGRWFDGIWNDGTWNNGRFTSGIWVLGTWNGGIFNTENGPSYWLDGTWNAGDFENGMWYNGVFDEKNGESRFGVKSYNSRTSTWHAGNWVSGSFHSRLNLDSNGNYITSNIHKYSIWRTGKWFSGNWYGGIAFNMDFKSGTWYGGILEDIQVIGFNQSVNVKNEIILNGIFKFNTGDTITIIDNNNNAFLSEVGTNSSPGLYTVLYFREDINLKRTILYVDDEFQDDITNETIIVDPTDTGLKIVSTFRNCNWKSGVWNNGIYEAGLWEGGIWYDGIFNATWM